ncbi:putative nucleotidyltransferase-like protein [Winogradskyella eximia]|uniref:Putative nucleotidyltransferase-like protein n=1 Tax=Winogradskyella eximia TaxID=262006 RepID=A0A3D9HDG4_9FLAO|nr:nucleotidyltransferase family protein [Winogradskyella eximia]RED47046.1 putative nucleotidyltransferase-like protein [Winogradskyella eximia]
MNNLAITYQHIADILSFKTNDSQLEKTISNTAFDWEDIVREGSKHYVIPAIYCRLKAKKLLHKLPEDLLNYLELITSKNRQRNSIILIQIRSISQLFNLNHIDHVFLKGSALLASGCFEDNAERMLGDIDILVSPEQLKEAYQLLCDNGYYPSDQTLGHDFFEHKHLPRLKTKLTDNRIAAVEVHRKLFTTHNDDTLNFEAIFNDRKQINTVYIPSKKHLLMHNILNFQINDYGALYNSISFRSTYDTIIIQRGYSGAKEWYKKKVYKNYFKYTSLFFEDIRVSTNVKINIFTNFYLFKLKHLKFYKNWNKLIGVMRFTPILLYRLWLFISNKTYRKAIITDRNRIFNHFKSILNHF